MRGRRARTGGAGVVAVVLLTGCSAPTMSSCTLIGGSNRIQVEVPADVSAQLESLSLELCQGDHCDRLTVPARTDLPGPRPTYFVGLDRFEGDWDPDAGTSLAVVGTAPSGERVVDEKDSFAFAHDYPNGKACDTTPSLSHLMVISG